MLHIVCAAARSFSPSLQVRALASLPKDVAKVNLNYQEPPPLGKRTGRYINQPDKGDAVDVHVACETDMHNGRLLSPPATCDTMGWTFLEWPTTVQDFRNESEVKDVYYQEIRALVKKATGARRVLVFDHTLRETGVTNLNAADASSAAAPVPRVHCDYTADGAPRRLMQLGRDGIYSHLRHRNMTEGEVAELAKGRFAFVNVWRPICEAPVERSPLAVCDCNSVPVSDHFLYELLFPDRTGENYSLRFDPSHRWYYYPRQTKDECLIFTVYDKRETGPRFVFHTAFEDPLTTPESPVRRSCEVRTVAFFGEDDVPDDVTVSNAAVVGDEVSGLGRDKP